MIAPDATPIQLVIEAATDPLTVLRICQGRLAEARTLATVEFDGFKASETIREVSVILGVVADSMRRHAISPPYEQGRRRMISKAMARPAEDAAPEPEPESWSAI